MDRVNKGRLGPKGMCSWEYNGHPDRLKTPVSYRNLAKGKTGGLAQVDGFPFLLRPQLIRKQGKLEPASWDEAMELIVSKSKEIIEKMTPHAIAFYVSRKLWRKTYLERNWWLT